MSKMKDERFEFVVGCDFYFVTTRIVEFRSVWRIPDSLTSQIPNSNMTRNALNIPNKIQSEGGSKTNPDQSWHHPVD